ncbi:MAG: hypothetical protein ABIJ41_00625 [Candidatus Omnitrophota bacterium]
MNLNVSFGHGTYREGTKIIKGQIILSPEKLFLKGPQEEYSATFIPVDKIETIRKVSGGLELYIRPTPIINYRAYLSADPRMIDELIQELVRSLKFQKCFLRHQWFREVKWTIN